MNCRHTAPFAPFHCTRRHLLLMLSFAWIGMIISLTTLATEKIVPLMVSGRTAEGGGYLLAGVAIFIGSVVMTKKAAR